MRRRFGIGLAVAVLAACTLGLVAGAFAVPPHRVLAIVAARLGFGDVALLQGIDASVVLGLRLPRVLLGVVIGGGLAVAGAALQGLLRNPLADPGLLGVSSGAALGAALFILGASRLFASAFGSHPLLALAGTQLSAFVFGLGTAIIVMRAALRGERTESLLLVGIGLNAVTLACIGLVTFLSNDEQLRALAFWNLGSLGGASWHVLAIVTPLVVLPSIVLLRSGRALDVLSLGDDAATHLGIDARRLRRRLVICCTLAVGAAVAACGLVGFVGLVVPHIVRLATGPDHRRVLAGSLALGAALVVTADAAARVIVAPAELPLGIVTALVGAPFFLSLVLRRRRVEAAW